MNKLFSLCFVVNSIFFSSLAFSTPSPCYSSTEVTADEGVHGVTAHQPQENEEDIEHTNRFWNCISSCVKGICCIFRCECLDDEDVYCSFPLHYRRIDPY